MGGPPGAPPTKICRCGRRRDRGETKPSTQSSRGHRPRLQQDARRGKERHNRASKTLGAVLAKIPAQKGFVRNSASAAHVLGIEGRNFKLGFAPGDKPMMDILGTQANRKFVETLLHEITGKDWTLKLTVNEELASRTAAVPEHSPLGFQRRTINPGSYRTIQRAGKIVKLSHAPFVMPQ